MGREISGQSVLTWTVCSAGKQREEKDFSRVSPKHKISPTLHTQSISHTHTSHIMYDITCTLRSDNTMQLI